MHVFVASSEIAYVIKGFNGKKHVSHEPKNMVLRIIYGILLPSE